VGLRRDAGCADIKEAMRVDIGRVSAQCGLQTIAEDGLANG